MLFSSFEVANITHLMSLVLDHEERLGECHSRHAEEYSAEWPRPKHKANVNPPKSIHLPHTDVKRIGFRASKVEEHPSHAWTRTLRAADARRLSAETGELCSSNSRIFSSSTS